jgi:hypothetical protein
MVMLTLDGTVYGVVNPVYVPLNVSVWVPLYALENVHQIPDNAVEGAAKLSVAEDPVNLNVVE